MGLVHEPEGDPTRMELRLDPRFFRDGIVVGADDIGGNGIVGIEQLAGQHPALRPPFVAIDQRGRITWRGLHQGDGILQFIGAAVGLRLGEDQAWVGSKGDRHGRDDPVDTGFVERTCRRHSHARLFERHDIRPSLHGDTHGRAA